MNTNLSFIRQILNSQIEAYQSEINFIDNLEAPAKYNRTEVLAEKIAAIQEFKTTLINFIAEANKLTKEQE